MRLVLSKPTAWAMGHGPWAMAILTLSTFASLSKSVINRLNRCFHKRQLSARLPDRLTLSGGRNLSDILRSYRFRHHVICCVYSNITTRHSMGHGTHTCYLVLIARGHHIIQCVTRRTRHTSPFTPSAAMSA